MAVFECIKPSRKMLEMRPSELKALLAQEDDLMGFSIPLEVDSLDEIGHIYRVPPKELEQIEKALKRQGIYVCPHFVVRSVNRRAW